MGNPLHDRRPATQWATVGQIIDIEEKLDGFEQLAAVVEADLSGLDAARIPSGWRKSGITGRLEFGFVDAERRLPAVECRAAVTVDVVCQRCLEAFRLPLDVETRLLLLKFDETADGYDEYEVWELDEETLRPKDIVEELLIMALPFAAMHTESAACTALSATTDDEIEEMNRPFAALRAQMTEDQ